MRDADRIRMYGKEAYVLPARRRHEKRFSIRAGDVVRELRMSGRTPAVCSALKSREFLQQNNLQLVERTGPNSGMSTTVTYTYEFIDEMPFSTKEDPWMRLRGALKDVFAELGGGERYARAQRDSFYDARENK
ncbi:MAG TPA: hypothetical protein VEI26_03025 [Terriglobales bacterium]|nr:hypothetical protein [Terriglobales bacterium]